MTTRKQIAVIRTYEYDDGGFSATLTYGKEWKMLSGGRFGFSSRYLARKAASLMLKQLQAAQPEAKT